MRQTTLLTTLLALLLPLGATAQDGRLVADGNSAETYRLIRQSGYNHECPDSSRQHATAHVQHIEQVYDEQLGKPVFVFHIHAAIDDDRGKTNITDRQRNEIKTDGKSPKSMVAQEGETLVMKWKFKLPKGFKIVSDGRRIRQIVQNLLTNTGQYILQGKIAVLLHKVADKIEITVIANMPAIQDKRYHAAVAKSKDDHKTGLSLRLRISRKLAMLLGGEVTRDYDYAGGIKYMVQLDIKEVGDTAHQAPAKVSNVIEED